MKISTKGRYALRLMIDLAINGTESYVPIKSCLLYTSPSPRDS